MGRFFRNDLHEEFGIWPLAYTAFGGPDVGVIAAVGAAVGDGDDGAFHDAWIAAGDRFLAEAANVRGRDSRCRLTLWASACYATPTIRSTDAGRPRLVAAFRKQIAASTRARAAAAPVRRCASRSRAHAARLPPARGPGGRARPLVILTNGYDATVTEMYFAEAWRSRGAATTACSSTAPGRARC